MSAKLRKAAANAIQVQDACNLSGVLFSFARDMQVICDEVDSGTTARNQHPIVRLYIDKLYDLAYDHSGRDNFDAYRAALKACEELAGTDNEKG